ncbi:reverse transcriptase domain-containing protein [Citrus sinensis]|uniref:Reverse transcriptase domain-containing protein n=1 Tax=Citrus sinensis TaxID=2711 RepID=A0ACB8N4L6_CITSI|nr:reverse transcriptase domain-containing protein [Citrus sinensis]
MGGGLALFWSSGVNVSIKSFSSHHIDAVVQNPGGQMWRCTGIYGHPEAGQKQHTWCLLKRLADLFPYPWCCFGDFNEILYLHEKSGGNERNLNAVAEFRETIQACNLVDMGYKGYQFTWSNRRFGTSYVEERLDRFLCSKDWSKSFQNLPASHLVNWVSDHCPIMLDIKERSKEINYKRRSFSRDYYEDMWSSYENCQNIVREEWEIYGDRRWENPVNNFQRAAKNSLFKLKIWSKVEFDGRKKKQEDLIEKLQNAKQNRDQYVDGGEIRKLEKQINNMLIDEEVYWRQRSRADWLREGDKNTKFFHSKASDTHGNWIDDKEKVEGEFCDYFQQLFTSSRPSHSQTQEALKEMPPKVTPEMHTLLEEPFTPEEIVNALSQICPTKAPGPDGLPAAFFQKHWQAVGRGVVTTCLHILNEQGDLALFNHTYIALIPKTEKPKKVTDFRPISLCNVVYRIIAKALANRLKLILPQIISPTQSAFIPNRLITDNVIIGYECLHKIRHSKGRKNGLVALKLDISKAYDRVEWSFLDQIMEKIGFSNKWRSLIMRCITTAQFSVIINGTPKGLILPERGLRQGCPLSPYLFIMCAEAFSNLLIQAERKQQIRGLRFAKDVTISHLLFADDSLVFTRASEAECKNLKGIFDCYAKASGQIFNYEKSSMFLSGKITSGQAATIKNIFQFKVVSKYEKYLGLPSMIGRRKSGFFNEVKLKVISKISSWRHKMFSSGGKEILIKVVAQAVPAYAMSVFRLPKGLCDDIQKSIAKFWWGSREDRYGIHWSRWDKMSQPKSRGGLGFRDLTSFNQALVAKQAWRLLQLPNSLLARVLQAKYYKYSSFLNATVGSNPSFIWKSILWGRQVIDKGARWRVGNGRKIRTYKDNWLPRPDTFKPISPQKLPAETMVADLIDEENQWIVSKLEQNFLPQDIEAILQIPLPRTKKRR